MISAAVSELVGTRVRFTPLHLDNIYKHFAWNNDPELNRLDSELPFVKEKFGKFKKRFERMLYHPQPTTQDFEVYAEDGCLIGVAYLAHISTCNRHCRLSLTIGDRNYWGQGYGRESMRVLLEHCFTTLRLHRVTTEVFEFNTPWKRLVNRMGFVKEGTERDYLLRDGRYWDREIYALLESEFKAVPVKKNGLRAQASPRQKRPIRCNPVGVGS